MSDTDPIVITGGSVTIEYSDTYKDNSPPPKKKKVKNNNAKLASLEVNGVEVKKLNQGDTITIKMKQNGQQGGKP
ncbi:MAG: hypothetical protein LC742_08885 [Acidobacteria bacterium]|nr:hypothetical protein [Acidobacteriota bacterium]